MRAGGAGYGWRMTSTRLRVYIVQKATATTSKSLIQKRNKVREPVKAPYAITGARWGVHYSRGGSSNGSLLKKTASTKKAKALSLLRGGSPVSCPCTGFPLTVEALRREGKGEMGGGGGKPTPSRLPIASQDLPQYGILKGRHVVA